MTAVRMRIAALIASMIIAFAALVVVAMNPEFWSEILGFAGPTVTALMVLARLEEYHAAVNSRMERLLALTATASRTEGILYERENPNHIHTTAVIKR